MKHRILLSLVLFSMIFSAQLSSAAAPLKNFNYWVRVPATTLDCESQAIIMGANFHVATALTVLESKCLGTVEFKDGNSTFKIYSINLKYAAESPVIPYVEIYGSSNFNGLANSNGGLYSTYAECLEDLASAASAFEANTKLDPIAAFCKSSQYGKNYVLQVEGFGAPAKMLYVYHPKMNSEPSFLTFIPQLIAHQGATLVKEIDANFFYYMAPHSLMTIREENFGIMPSAHCAQQQSEAEKIMTSSGATLFNSICAHAAIEGSATLRVMSDGYSMLSSGAGTGTGDLYFSFEECMGDKARVLENMLQRSQKPLGAICRPDIYKDDRFVMDVYQTL